MHQHKPLVPHPHLTKPANTPALLQQIDIAAADVEGWTANILQMHQVCDSMVYLYKGVPKMHTDSEHMHNHQLPDRTTMTVLPVYNSTDATQLDRCAYPLNDASLPGFSTYLNAEVHGWVEVLLHR